jgi:hypothetical protein
VRPPQQRTLLLQVARSIIACSASFMRNLLGQQGVEATGAAALGR